MRLAGAKVLPTTTGNFPNRLGDDANVYLTSAKMAPVGGIFSRLPTLEEYFEYISQMDSIASGIYRYMNFDQTETFQKAAKRGKLITAEQIGKLVLYTHRHNVSLLVLVSNSARQIPISNMLKHTFAKSYTAAITRDPAISSLRLGSASPSHIRGA